MFYTIFLYDFSEYKKDPVGEILMSQKHYEVISYDIKRPRRICDLHGPVCVCFYTSLLTDTIVLYAALSLILIPSTEFDA